jgi:hypothetical protein
MSKVEQRIDEKSRSSIRPHDDAVKLAIKLLKTIKEMK